MTEQCGARNVDAIGAKYLQPLVGNQDTKKTRTNYCSTMGDPCHCAEGDGGAGPKGRSEDGSAPPCSSNGACVMYWYCCGA
jgi:hypothetical protein